MNFTFSKEQIDYLRQTGRFTEEYLQFLANFKFSGNIYGLPEGSVAFPKESIASVDGTMFEIVIETLMLKDMNFPTLDASWANNVVMRGGKEQRVEDGLSTAQGRAHRSASWAAFIGGLNRTTNMDAHLAFGIPLAIRNDEGQLLQGNILTGGEKAAHGGVFKLSSFDGEDRVKASGANPAKASLPGRKRSYDITDDKGQLVDVIIGFENGDDLELPQGQEAAPRQIPWVQEGKVVYHTPDAFDVRAFVREQVQRYQGITLARLSTKLAGAQRALIDHASSLKTQERPTDLALLSTLHTVARTQAPMEYGIRFSVPDDKVSWDVDFPEYNPSNILTQKVLNNDYRAKDGGWADPEDFSIVLDDIASERRERMISAEGRVHYDPKTGLPLNPRGRTGIKNRGELGKYGPNQAVDPIVTRINPATGKLEVLLIRRKDNNKIAFPGGMVERFRIAEKAYSEDAMGATLRELKEETGIVLDSQDIESSSVVYEGYVDDFRNTDNAWMETKARHFHVADPARAQKLIPQAADDAIEAKWYPVEEIPELNASHGEILKIALQKMTVKQDSQTDPALLSDYVGGINLAPTMLHLEIKRDGQGIPLPLPQQPIDSMTIHGFAPIIINIMPANVPLLLGEGLPKNKSYDSISLAK